MKTSWLVLCLLLLGTFSPANCENYSLWNKVQFLRYATHNQRVAKYYSDIQKAREPEDVNAATKLGESAVPISPVAQSIPESQDKNLASKKKEKGHLSLSDELKNKVASEVENELKKKQKADQSGSRTHMIRIYGNDFLQYYYMNLMVGDSRSQQSVILDTGSDMTAFTCSKIGINV